jgi:hypothetical protein
MHRRHNGDIAMGTKQWKRVCLCGAALLIAGPVLIGCETQHRHRERIGEPQWAANGWLSPGPTGNPILIGTYLTRKACDDAVKDWMSRQVVGHAIHGECLPIDRR